MSEERAEPSVGAVLHERAEMIASAVVSERAVLNECADPDERAGTAEGAVSDERAGRPEGAETIERAVPQESAVTTERVDVEESAERPERTGDAGQSSVADADAASSVKPFYVLGYPRIESPSHSLWEAQQAGWPDTLPHEAWRDLIAGLNKEDQPKADSAKHPAFGEAYVPNYMASQEKPPEPYAPPQVKQRR